MPTTNFETVPTLLQRMSSQLADTVEKVVEIIGES